MAQTLTVKLFRGDNTSWGFRLQGGKDFSYPLSIQRVSTLIKKKKLYLIIFKLFVHEIILCIFYVF